VKVLCDFHHSDLWWSMYLLFVERLGWDLYRPYGMDWYDLGYHRLYGALEEEDPYRFISYMYLEDKVTRYRGNIGVCDATYCGCRDYPLFNLITLEEFSDSKFDFVVTTAHDNELPFYKLIKDRNSSAKLIRQSGNYLDVVDYNICKNVLDSTGMLSNIPDDINYLKYHQEFYLDIFKYVPPTNFNVITSVLNFLRQWDTDGENYGEIWDSIKNGISECKWIMHGFKCDNGHIWSKRNYVTAIQNSSFIYHIKPFDGYGHCSYNSLALGRPLIVKNNYKVGPDLDSMLKDGDTVIKIDTKDICGSIQKIKKYISKEEVLRMSENAYNVFCNTVNFDNEFEQIKLFLNRCK